MPDEKFVTEQAYDNPKFVEDLVRDVALACHSHEQIGDFVVASENFEAIHNHSAYAEIYGRGKLQQRDRKPALPGARLPSFKTLVIMAGFGTLAQSVEQRTFNPLVGSSSLPRPTNSFRVVAKQKQIARFSGLFTSVVLTAFCWSHHSLGSEPKGEVDIGAFGLPAQCRHGFAAKAIARALKLRPFSCRRAA